jgi:tRNA(fMet)-specific endonuclease VapC
MPLYMLDTNIVSDLIKNPQGRVAGKIAEIGERNVVSSIIVAAELRFGAAKRGAPRLTEQVEAIIDALTILPLQVPADTHYGQIRNALEQKGQIIGANDLLIASHALSMECVLVTANVAEFERVEGLVLENWLGS